MKQKGLLTKRIATVGIFISLALILSYVESLFPFNFGIPGIKLGLANVVVITGMYCMNVADVCLISFIRIFVSGLLFGNMMSLLYSFAGGLLSLVVMLILKRTGAFSVIGVSIAGGVCHNAGQILVAMIATGIPAISYYLPILIGAGIAAGFLMGLIASRVLLILSKSSVLRP